VHDVADPYDPKPSPPPDELELSLQRLEAEMDRRRAADDPIAPAVEIMRHQAVKDQSLAAKQARLLAILRAKMNSAAAPAWPDETLP
jgi:hypothetical protein